jgi:hypothetical protein
MSKAKKQTQGQLLAQIMCERLAKKNGKKLPSNIWSDPDWKKFLVFQISLANGLLKIYDYNDILEALNRFPYVYSLNYKPMHATISQINNAKKIDEFVDLPAEKPILTKREEKSEKSLFESLN